jgi:phospholipase/carboxylesterase
MADLPLIHRTAPAREGSEPYPGLLLLHGRGADESDLLPLAGELDPQLYTVTPRAPFQFPWGGFAWYGLDPRGVGYPDAATLAQSLATLREFIDAMLTMYPIDPARLLIGGFSQGAATAGTLALLEPVRFLGATILSGYVPLHSDLALHPESASDLSVFQAHGTHDDVIPVSWARETRDYLQSTSVQLMYREYPMGHQISAPELGDLGAWIGDLLA